ncbi:MAG: NAD(P)H-dependent oxidoreductase [Candidatus Woesearchaeota archaeon]
MNFKDIVLSRYATKKFNGKKIPESKVKELFEIIRYSPSSFNIQPWVIKVVKDKETKEKLLQFGFNQPQIITCSHLLVFCANKDIEKNIDKLAKAFPNATEYVNMMRGFVSQMNEEQKLSWAQRQVYIALGFAMLGAKSLGFDSCPMEGFMPDKFKEVLKLPDNLVPSVLLPIGYADDKPRKKYRFSKNEVFLI